MSTIVSETIEVDSCSLHFLVTGEGRGRDIVLLHGMKFQAATWQELGTLQVLADREMRALAVDMPGFGQSPECAVKQDTVPAEIAGAKRVIIDGAS